MHSFSKLARNLKVRPRADSPELQLRFVMEMYQAGYYTEDFRTQEVPGGFDFSSYDYNGEDLSFLLDSKGPVQPQYGDTYGDLQKDHSSSAKVLSTDPGLFNLESYPEFSCWSSYTTVPDGMMADRQQGAFQDSTSQTYQNLLPPCPATQSSPFSSSVDHSGLYQPTKELSCRGAGTYRSACDGGGRSSGQISVQVGAQVVLEVRTRSDTIRGYDGGDVMEGL
ncbi:hypothetical protein NFI96_021264 [Prochilodus magdalenae]|nr:hypothetical protein NFI96_021264 [Prochilodus magdalenae]